jgi:hypothetical protein
LTIGIVALSGTADYPARKELLVNLYPVSLGQVTAAEGAAVV